VAHWALGFLYFVSYDSQGYGGGILTFPNLEGQVPVYIYIYIYPSGTGWFSTKSRYDRRPVTQCALVPSPLGIRGFHPNEFQSNIRIGTLRRSFWCYHWEDQGNPRKTLIELAGRRTFRMQTTLCFVLICMFFSSIAISCLTLETLLKRPFCEWNNVGCSSSSSSSSSSSVNAVACPTSKHSFHEVRDLGTLHCFDPVLYDLLHGSFISHSARNFRPLLC
jgi:hypothetical protein